MKAFTRGKFLASLALVCGLLCGCGEPSSSGESLVSSKASSGDIFPQSDGSHYVGDTMPYYENGTYYVYYLNDLRSGPYGFHPIWLRTTSDFCSWSEPVEAIPASTNPGDQDVGLGTGSLIKGSEGTYHFYYVGYNNFGNVTYVEKIQHATSSDLVHWTKHPEDGFYGGCDDFRDPYVYWNAATSDYRMLITTKRNGLSVLVQYASSDLTSWSDQGVFYANDNRNYNMECSSLLKIGAYYYLTFSAQLDIGPTRTVNYRYSSDLLTWKVPNDERLDGAGFYAGRLVKGQDDRVFCCGWDATKQYGYDEDPFDWGGSLVSHEIFTRTNGEIYIGPINEIASHFNGEIGLKTLTSQGVTTNNSSVTFPSNDSGLYLHEAYPSGNFLYSFDVSFGALSGKFGLTFNAKNGSLGSLFIVFDLDNDALSFYQGSFSQGSFASTAQISLSLAYSRNQTYHVSLYGEDQVVALYVGGKRGLTTRMMKAVGNPFGFFAYQCSATLTLGKAFH